MFNVNMIELGNVRLEYNKQSQKYKTLKPIVRIRVACGNASTKWITINKKLLDMMILMSEE